MCCYYDEKATERLRKRMTKVGGEMTFWKVYRREGRVLLPSVQRQPVIRRPGNVISDRVEQPAGADRHDDGVAAVGRGIHVFVKKGEARTYSSPERPLVPVQCHVGDLVCGETRKLLTSRGHSKNTVKVQAVFMKVRILKKDFDKAVSGG